uniref:myotubularin-related protein 9 isoform X2 n=1 Tax=Ciona intestinalis TaxID=7719 RepID=UPI0000523322|nr:myotubularin-related protein 9 isoform X2 [Ciona intestinalis]|eukprot:XP_002129995.1 myotubularin-related protein 9 isoform X2 [Ciona intestinalis]
MEFSEYIRTPKVEECVLEGSNIPTYHGTACLTGHHLILYSQDGENKEYWILHKNVDSVEKRYSQDRNALIFKCKNFKKYQLTIPSFEDANNICSSVEALSCLGKPNLQYPYFYRPTFKFEEDGFDLFHVENEFADLCKKSDQWRISSINLHFKACKSYPSQVIVPKLIDDKAIEKSAEFRQDGRFPILSYYHTNRRVVMRCGQPMTGTSNKRCKEDEKMINIILGPAHRGYILDLRTSQSATNARSKGGGFETEFNYPQWRKIHHGLQKHKVQQESLIRLVEACHDQSTNSEKWQSKLESCNWLSLVKETLSAACLVAQCVDKEGASVLVHGSHGVDCTLQVTALTQVLLDPLCRTMRGFLCLIDREWIKAGHPFASRCFHSALSNQKTQTEGPSFTVFLDCVFQLQQQFPLAFEFNSRFLCELSRHAYASQFGTFLCNSEMERRQHKVQTKTVSLWSYFLSEEVLPLHLNIIYESCNGVIWPSVAPHSLYLWDGLFLPDIDPEPTVQKNIKETMLRMEQLQLEICSLNNEISILKQQQARPDQQ